jgi:hypothetical protein
MDRASQSVTFTRFDGRTATVALDPSPFRPHGRLVQFQWSHILRGLLAVTDVGDEIAFEMPDPDGSDQRDGRLVVYLDQNQGSSDVSSYGIEDGVDVVALLDEG